MSRLKHVSDGQFQRGSQWLSIGFQVMFAKP
jgi:hypothetical protein